MLNCASSGSTLEMVEAGPNVGQRNKQSTLLAGQLLPIAFARQHVHARSIDMVDIHGIKTY